MMEVIGSARSAAGRRANNEDACCAEPGLGLFADDGALGGGVVGFAVGWLLGAYARQAGALRELEQRIADQEFARQAAAPPEPAEARATAPAPSPAPVVAPAPVVWPAPAPAAAAPPPAPEPIAATIAAAAPVAPTRERAVFDIGPAPDTITAAAAVAWPRTW